MARPGTGGGSSSGFSGSRSSSSSSNGRSSGSSRPSGGGSSFSGGSSSGSSSSSRRSSSSGSSFSSGKSSSNSSSSSSNTRSLFGNSSSSPKKYTTSSSSTDSTQRTRSSSGRPVGGSTSLNNSQYQDNHSGYGHHHQEYYGGSGHHHYGYPYRRPSLFRRMFYRRGYEGYHYQHISPVKTGCGLGCLIFFLFPLLTTIVVMIFVTLTNSSSNTNESGTAQFAESLIENSNDYSPPETIRIPLSPDKVNETDYYQDDLDWIEEPEMLLSGLKHFYEKTGIQPYLKLVPPVSGTNTDEECDTFANELYDELFRDEGHFLLVYVEDLNPDELGYLAYVCGSDATAVMDDPAVDILYQYIDQYWFNEDFTTEEVFSNAFRDTADDIMSQSVIPGSWFNNGNGWQFADENSQMLCDTWAEIDGSLYYFTPDAYMATGWIEENGKWYYTNENGSMATGWTEIDKKWYYLNESGVCLIDTTTPDGYYVDENGVWVE